MEDTPTYGPLAPAAALPSYVSHKLVSAVQIAFIQQEPSAEGTTITLVPHHPVAPFTVTEEWFRKHQPQDGWWFIRYQDGYTSACPDPAFRAGFVARGDWGPPRHQESKYGVGPRGRIVNRHTGQAIPDEEPIFILRARDIHALPALRHYMALVRTPEHQDGVAASCAAFAAFAASYRDRMREPTSQPPKPPSPMSMTRPQC